MKILSRSEQDYLTDVLTAIRMALFDLGDDPEGTAVFINGKISGILIPAVGGKKGVKRASETLEKWQKNFSEKGISRGQL